MKKRRCQSFGRILAFLIVYVMITGFQSKGPGVQYVTIALQAKEEISEEQFETSVQIIRQRIAVREIDGEVRYDQGKLILNINSNDSNDETLEALSRRGHLLFMDESGNTLLDNVERSFVENVKVETNNYDGRPVYSLKVQLKDDVIEHFTQVTQENVGKHIALIFEGYVFSNPLIVEPIVNGQFIFSGLTEETDAKRMEEIWKSQCLPCEFERVE